MLSEIEDNRHMGSLGRRSRMEGGVGGGEQGEEDEYEEEDERYARGDHEGVSTAAQQQYHPQQQFHYPTSRNLSLRLQTNVQHGSSSTYITHHQNQPFFHPPAPPHYSQPPPQQQQQHPHHRQPLPNQFIHHHQVKLSPIAEASPTSTSADYPSLKKAGSEILAASISGQSPGGASNLRNSNATVISERGPRRRSGSGSGENGSSGGTGESPSGTSVSVGATVGSSRRQSTNLTAITNGNGMLGGGVGNGNGGGLSPLTPATATSTGVSASAGSPMSQYATPTTASASPGGPGLSPNVVIPSPASAGAGMGVVGGIGTPEVTREWSCVYRVGSWIADFWSYRSLSSIFLAIYQSHAEPYRFTRFVKREE